MRLYGGSGPVHDADRERASSIVNSLHFDPANPEIRDNPIFMRKKKVDPEADFDGKSLYLCGQSDKALSRLLHETDSKYTGKNLKLIQKAESFMSFEYD